MPHKHLLFRSEAREKVLHGATAIADAVRVTLGPPSRSVLIEKKWGAPLVCNDGVTIAKEFSLEDPEEDLGAQVLREAAERTGDAVGDGTTTSTLLAHAILEDGMRHIAARARAIDLKRGLDRAARAAIEAPRSFHVVGQFFQDFSEETDEMVPAMLAAADGDSARQSDERIANPNASQHLTVVEILGPEHIAS